MRGVHQCPRRHKTRGIHPHLPYHQRVSRPSGYKHSVSIQQQVKEDDSETPKHRHISRRTKRAMGDERTEQLKKMEKELREVREPIRSSAETLKRKNELKRQLQESKGGSSKEL
ncbi:hypothetical protein E4U40_005404 [Claviceps sp. LM458 group G5]|nr:hypothetical protein E4U40_005404 [Claviceps sp. LM458 group G5]